MASGLASFVVRRRRPDFWLVGQSTHVTGAVVCEADPVQARIDVTVGMASLSRNRMLRSRGWFDVARHPEVRVQAAGLRWVGGSDPEYEGRGDLTLRGVTAPVEVTLGPVDWGEENEWVAVVDIADRGSHGLTRWSRVLDQGMGLQLETMLRPVPGPS